MTFSLINDLLKEDRKKNLKYAEKFDKKDLKKLVEVTVEYDLEKVGGKKWRDAAIGYLDLQHLRDDVVLSMEKANDSLREDLLNLFDESDRFATRVVKVGDICLKLAKDSVPEPKTDIDFEKVVAAIAEISEEMAAKVEELKKQYTTIKPPAAPKKAAVRVSDDTPTHPAIAESITSVISSKLKKFLASFKSWFTKIDSKIEKVEDMIAAM